jgi:uncharacterized protein
MKKITNLHQVDVKALAKGEMQVQGAVALTEFERLSQDCSGEVQGDVSWSAQGSVQPDQKGKDAVWLHLEAKAVVPLTCQRCLQPVAVDLLIDQDFRFVPDEATALAEDDESEEDLLVLEDSLDLQALIEDELLMGLPLVPMHPTCLSEHAHTSDQDAADLLAAKPNPFAILASLKTQKH